MISKTAAEILITEDCDKLIKEGMITATDKSNMLDFHDWSYPSPWDYETLGVDPDSDIIKELELLRITSPFPDVSMGVQYG